MTITEFEITKFSINTRVEYKGIERKLMSVDFEECLIAFNAENDDQLQWVRCENVKIL